MVLWFLLRSTVLFVFLDFTVLVLTLSRMNKEMPKPYPLEVHQLYIEKLRLTKRPKIIGVWSDWSEWSPCSRSCGGGVTKQVRHCVPKPNNNYHKDNSLGNYTSNNRELQYLKKMSRRRRQNKKKIVSTCIGLYKRIHMCNTQDCPKGSGDFRTQQCSSFNGRPFKGLFYVWEPYIKQDKECVLNCRPRGKSFYATLNETVRDGTVCNRPVAASGKFAPMGTRGICVDGYCKIYHR